MPVRTSSRRKFLASAASSFAFTFIPRSVWGANERLNLAGIGVGGKGAGEVKDLSKAGATFVALCDVDSDRAGGTYQQFPDAKRYTDFRVMLEKEKNIDAVTVSTPDHTHAVASLLAMSLGKHVYCQKPLTHSVHEARVMAQAARYYKVQTQMGNQAHAGEPIRRAVELVRAGIIGPVREVHVWTNRPIWPQGQKARAERRRLADQVKPKGLDWDLWLGPAPLRDYNACYVPFKWRGWWDFGTGALGDMACHMMDMPYWALNLGAPLSVEAESGGLTDETGPDWSTITYRFAARGPASGGSLGSSGGRQTSVHQPAVKFVWYDGTKEGKANVPYDLLARAVQGAQATPATTATAARSNRRRRPPSGVGDHRDWDAILVGDRGMMLFRRRSADWIVTPGRQLEQFRSVPQTIRRVASEDAEWIEACKGGPKALSNFDYSGPLTEMVLLGNLAVRLGKKIEWDAKALKATNAPEADRLIRPSHRAGWELPVPESLQRIG